MRTYSPVARGLFALVFCFSASLAEATKFTSNQAIVFTPGGVTQPAAPIVTSGLSGVITRVTVTLNDVHITTPSQVFVELDYGDASNPIVLLDLMENNGSVVNVTANHATITFDDFANRQVPLPDLTSGNTQRIYFFEIRHNLTGWSPETLRLSGTDPNREWKLWVGAAGNGSIAGWSIDL